MTEEKENVCKCNDVKNLAKKVAVIALGTFIGVYAGLSLFAATHKPPKPQFHHMKRPPIEHRANLQKGPHSDIHRVNFEKKDFPAPRRGEKRVDD